MTTSRFPSFTEFWPFYLSEHGDPVNRLLHATGPTILPLALVAAVWTGAWWLLLTVPVLGYGASWIGHFLIERNTPATFTYPLWSLRGDFKMVGLMYRGKLGAELAAQRVDRVARK